MTLQVRLVLLMSCQWTQSATESFTVHLGWHGSVQVMTVWLMVDRWLFSLTLENRHKIATWPTGWVLTSHIGLDWWGGGGKQRMKVSFCYFNSAMYIYKCVLGCLDSVFPSHVCFMTKQNNILIPHDRTNPVVFWRQPTVVCNVTFYLKFWLKDSLSPHPLPVSVDRV